MRRSAMLLAGLTLMAPAARASDIVLSAVSNSFECAITMQAGVPIQVYALATLGDDAAANGILGAEFRIYGFDTRWAVVSHPNPAFVTDLGNPVDDGCLIQFAGCQTGTDQIVVLYSITVIPILLSPEGYTVRIYEHMSTTQPSLNCPWLVTCNSPTSTRICVPGGRSCINLGGCCVTPVESVSWSRVKSLYER